MLRILFRFLLWILLALLGRRLFSRRPGPGPQVGGDSSSRRGAPPKLDRSDVLDVPFTEVPPTPDPAPPGAARPS